MNVSPATAERSSGAAGLEDRVARHVRLLLVASRRGAEERFCRELARLLIDYAHDLSRQLAVSCSLGENGRSVRPGVGPAAGRVPSFAADP